MRVGKMKGVMVRRLGAVICWMLVILTIPAILFAPLLVKLLVSVVAIIHVWANAEVWGMRKRAGMPFRFLP